MESAIEKSEKQIAASKLKNAEAYAKLAEVETKW